MQRLRESRLQAAQSRLRANDVELGVEGAPAVPRPAVGSLTVNNATLGFPEGGYLSICLTTLGDRKLMSSIGEAPHRLAELRHVTFQGVTCRDACVSRLPLRVRCMVDEDCSVVADASRNPTHWNRVPFVYVVLLAPTSLEHYKNALRPRAVSLRDSLNALPQGVASTMCIVCIKPHATEQPSNLRKVDNKIMDDFRSESVVRLDIGVDQAGSHRSMREWDTVRENVATCFSTAFDQRLLAYNEEVRALGSALDGSTAHLMHHLLVKVALVTMLECARLYEDAAVETTLMDASYETHLQRHPEMHGFGVNVERDLQNDIAGMQTAYLQHALLPDGRMNSFVMRMFLVGTQLRLMLATIPEAGITPDVVDFTAQLQPFIVSCYTQLRSVQPHHSVPPKVPQIWCATTALSILSAFAAAQVLSSVPAPAPKGPVATHTLRLSMKEAMKLDWEGGPGPLRQQVVLERLLDSLRRLDADGGPGVPLVEATAIRTPAPACHVHRYMLELGSVAHMALVEFQEMMNLHCELHPTAAELHAACMLYRPADDDTVQPIPVHSTCEVRPPTSLAVAMMTNPATGSFRTSQVLVPHELMKFGAGDAVPPWLTDSPHAILLTHAPELEELLTAVACTCAWCALHAGLTRQASTFLSFAARYLFRADQPDAAANLWWFVSLMRLQAGWNTVGVMALDRLLASACLLKAEFAAVAATQLLAMPPAAIQGAFRHNGPQIEVRGGAAGPSQVPDSPSTAAGRSPEEEASHELQLAALHALSNFCPSTEISLESSVFVDPSKSQTSAFYGEKDKEGAPLLRPRACTMGQGAHDCAQLVGLATLCEIRVCVTSKLPVTIRISNVTLQLQHISSSSVAPPSSALDRPGAGARPASTRPLQPHVLDDDVLSSPSETEPEEEDVSTLRSIRRGPGGRATRGFSLTSYTASALGGAGRGSTASDAGFDPTEDLLAGWSHVSTLECPLLQPDGVTEIKPGDNFLVFQACPIQEGLHLMDCMRGLLDCPASHVVYVDTQHADAAVGVGTPEVSRPLAGALVALADEDNVALSALLPGGVILEAEAQWVGLLVERMAAAVSDVTLRVALNVLERAAPMDFVRVSGVGPELGGEMVAFWQVEGQEAVPIALADGEVLVAGELGPSGILWLPVVCEQQQHLPQQVDVGSPGTGDASAAGLDVERSVADIEVAVMCFSGCWRSKHVRLRLPVRRAIHTTVTAHPLHPGTLAIQVSQHSSAPLPIAIADQKLELQPGLAFAPSKLPPQGAPFTMAPGTTHLSLYVVSHTSPAAQTASSHSCAINSTCVLTAADLGHVPLQELDTNGRIVRRKEPICATRLPRGLCEQGLLSGGAPRKLPAAVAAAAVPLRLEELGAVVGSTPASACAHVHRFMLELSTFSTVAMLVHSGRMPASSLGPLPVVVFMGPQVVKLGVDAALIWQIRWEGGEDEVEVEGSGKVEDLQYEVLLPSGWQRIRKQKGRVKLANSPGSFATVAITMAPTVAGRVPVPTLVVVPPASGPVRAAAAWIHVAA